MPYGLVRRFASRLTYDYSGFAPFGAVYKGRCPNANFQLGGPSHAKDATGAKDERSSYPLRDLGDRCVRHYSLA